MRSTDSALSALRPRPQANAAPNSLSAVHGSGSSLSIPMELTFGGHRIGSPWWSMNRTQLPRNCGFCRRAQAASHVAGRRVQPCSARQAFFSCATRRRKLRADPAYPAARALGSSRLALIRACVSFTSRATMSRTIS